MLTCGNCHAENPDHARFCLACGLPMHGPATVESRRLVTVVFCDLEDSTPLASRLDAESLRKIVTRYFEEMRDVLERHGGTVEKFIGDAVMAVFGVPTLHEDDALRAVHAAMAMHQALEVLNDELDRDWRVRLQHRIGVNSGEVVTGDALGGQTLITGEAVHLASRLESAAAPGTILLGEDTYLLVRDAVSVEGVDLPDVKGVGAVRAHRLLAVTPGAMGHARRLDSPFVNRDRESALLRDAFERMLDSNRCQMITLLGSAGVGKSRLVDELVRWTAERAAAYRGRCLAYGEGITYWPIVEIGRQAAGVSNDDSIEEARRKVVALLPGDSARVGNHVARTIGIGEPEPQQPEEIFWAIRTFFESLARRRPLILVFDDIQWGEPTFLELVDHIAEWSRDAPIMLLCLARPDLLESNRTWGGGKMNATSLLLEPLHRSDGDTLVRNLLGSAELAERDRARIVEVSGGNPLFVEEILAMLIDDGLLTNDGARWVPADDLTSVSIPPTISLLLAARLDRLDPSERTVIEHAAVLGKEFPVAALTALLPPGLSGKTGELLAALVRKELVLPAREPGLGGELYGYRHLLIRDAAYDSLPKQARAELHERFADWLERTGTGRIEEYQEFIGYHLEQAHRYRDELARGDGHADVLATRAGEHLAAAGRRALARGDMRASANLLGRAAGILPDRAPERGPLLADLAESFYGSSDLDLCIARLDQLIPIARRSGYDALLTWAELRRTELGFLTDPRGTDVEAFRVQAQRAIETFARIGDEGRLASALTLSALLGWLSGAAGEMLSNAELALSLARHVDDWRTIALAASYVGRACILGPTTCADADARLSSLVDELGDDRMAQATARLEWAVILAMLERFDEAREHVERSRRVFEDLGQRRWLAAVSGLEGRIDWMGDDLVAAERNTRIGYNFFRQQHDSVNANAAAADLAQMLVELGRFDEAGTLVDEVAKGAGLYDLEPQIGWRCAKARILARHGAQEEAEAIAGQAEDLVAPTEFLDLQADVMMHRAEVLSAARRTTDATALIPRAIQAYERKGDLAGARKARLRRDELT